MQKSNELIFNINVHIVGMQIKAVPSNKQQLSHLIAIYSPRRFNTAESLVVSELEWFLIRLLVCLRVQHFILSAPLVSVKTPEVFVFHPSFLKIGHLVALL